MQVFKSCTGTTTEKELHVGPVKVSTYVFVTERVFILQIRILIIYKLASDESLCLG